MPQNKYAGAWRPAKVTKYYMHPQLEVPVADVVDSYGGVFKQCQMIDMGGGSEDSFDYSPPPEDLKKDADGNALSINQTGDVMIAFSPGRRSHPVIIGTAYTPKRGDHITTEVQDTGDTVDYGNKATMHDRVVKHKDVRMVFASTGTWCLDLKTSEVEQGRRSQNNEPPKRNKPARMELDEDTFLRVSHNGAADEFVLLGDETLKHLRAIHGRLDTLAAKIEEVETHVQTVAKSLTDLYKFFTTATYLDAVSGPTPLTVGGAGSATLIAVYSDDGKKVTDFEDIWDFSKQADLDPTADGDPADASKNSDTYKAGCFRVSNRSIDDQGSS